MTIWRTRIARRGNQHLVELQKREANRQNCGESSSLCTHHTESALHEEHKIAANQNEEGVHVTGLGDGAQVRVDGIDYFLDISVGRHRGCFVPRGGAAFRLRRTVLQGGVGALPGRAANLASPAIAPGSYCLGDSICPPAKGPCGRGALGAPPLRDRQAVNQTDGAAPAHAGSYVACPKTVRLPPSVLLPLCLTATNADEPFASTLIREGTVKARTSDLEPSWLALSFLLPLQAAFARVWVLVNLETWDAPQRSCRTVVELATGIWRMFFQCLPDIPWRPVGSERWSW